MVTPTKLNFLHRILQKHQEQSDTSRKQTDNSPQRPKWMKKLNMLSPSKLRAPPPSPIRAMSPADMNYQRQYDFMSPQRQLPRVPRRQQSLLTVNDNHDVVDLEKVLSDFETDYLSPTKRNSPPTTSKFVKKMVAIFEKKTHTSYKYPKNLMVDSERRKSSFDISNEIPIDYFTPMNNTYIVERQTKSLDNSLGYSPEFINISEGREGLDEGISDESVEFADEVIESSNESLYEYPPPRSDASLKRERAPKIIGGFLKKPIEIEDTKIDWLPAPASKLPRKKSFTKFFGLLSGKKIWDSNNKNSLLRRKSHKEPKEYHDSGYDEKSISPTSSLASTSSFPNTLGKEGNNTHGRNERVTGVSTFLSSNSPTKNIYATADDIFPEINTNDNKKLMFEEMPRSEVRLSLGPFFPIQPKLFIKSLDRRETIKESTEDIQTEIIYSNTNKYKSFTSSVTPLPKHPFISKDEGGQDSSIIPFDDDEFNQVELRRTPKWTFPSSDAFYDVPKSTSTSEFGAFTNEVNKRHTYDNSYDTKVTYDVPRIIVPPRPKSSVYEDCQSLRRRTAGATSSLAETHASFYAPPTASRSQFATIKPRNSAVVRNREFLSMERFRALHTLTVPNIHESSSNNNEMTRF